MGIIGYIFISIAALLLILVAVVIIRTLTFKPKKTTIVTQTNEEKYDGDKAVSNLQELIRCKTISYRDTSLEDDAEFEKLINLLPKLYPNVTKKCHLMRFEGRGLLFKWEGKSHDAPSVMMAHYDVVPVNEEDWERDPFDPVIINGEMWGRGTVDTKITFNGAMTAADQLISEGFVPENDIYFAFSGSEETNGQGAPSIVDYFEKNNINLALVVDEGGAVVEGVFPGVSRPCALVGIAEKGMINVEYTNKSRGGHASSPKPHTPVGILSKACTKVESHPFKMKISEPVKILFDLLGRHTSFAVRMIFANLWLFKPALNLLTKLVGGEINAILRTTCAFTQMKGSNAENVIPPEASMVSNLRLIPGDTIDSAIDYLKKTINDDSIEIKVINGMNPSRVSKVDCSAYEKVETAIVSTWKETIVVPYLMVACSDSRHYGRISDKVYRFSAADFTNDERKGIHGNNERIRIDVVKRAVEFYLRLLKQC